MFVKYIGSGKTTLNIIDWDLMSSHLPVLFMWHYECDQRQDGRSHTRHTLWCTFHRQLARTRFRRLNSSTVRHGPAILCVLLNVSLRYAAVRYRSSA